MPFETRILLVGFAASLAASACGSILQTPDGGTDGGQDSGGLVCRGLDEAACRALAGCQVAACSLCGGVPQYAGCYDPARDPSPICAAATSIACPAPCSILDEASCKQRTDCVAQVCPNCNGGSNFLGCSTLTDAIIACPAIACPVPCSQVTAKDECEIRPDCHSVFVDPGTCDCAVAGCCTRFSRCADGDKAICKPPSGAACASLPPYCEGPYVVSYTAACFEGCVQATDCAPAN
jgi:hypothetical protein